MKNVVFFLTFSSLLLAASCGKENPNPIDTAKLNLSFKASYGGETLIIQDKNYNYLGKPIRFSKINFYIADLVAVNNDGETELSEIQFINITETHKSQIDAEQGAVMSFSNVPIGSYNQLKFGVGVPADLNKTNPSDYSTSHPLGADNSGEYWEAWDSYIFAKIEGQYDVNGDGFDADDISFAYHIGGRSDLYKPIELDNNLILSAGETTNLIFEIDIAQLFIQGQGDPFELAAHDPAEQIPEMILIMENFPNALKVK